jgi:nucleotide-binding universal stress UspA family protein
VRLEEGVFKHVLCTLDGSSESREILPMAAACAHLFGARITLLRIVPLQFPVTSTFTSHGTSESLGQEEHAAGARAALEEEAAALRDAGLEVGVEVLNPPDGILEYAEKGSADLIAMATHGRGGVARLILGSVADKVIRGGSIPVLLHRTR